MEQFEALWLFQAEDMKADAIANAIKRSPTRQKLEKTRDLILERQKQYKQIESDTAAMVDRKDIITQALDHSQAQLSQLRERFEKERIRATPGSVVRRGAFLEPDTIVLPSFVNIGAHVGSGTMVDTWATVGSCAQVGKNVHIAGGAGIGGVLEPVQAGPTIIEDNCFIGARSEVVEGVIVGEGSVISMGVFLGKSTRIYDRTTGEISYGRIPPHSVVVAGNLPSKDGKYSLYAAIIVKKVDEKTLSKVGLNELLRQAQEEVNA